MARTIGDSLRLLFFLAAFVFIVQQAGAQCPDDWLAGQGLPGVNGTVDAITTWDADRDGPLPTLLVVGGSFTIAGHSFVSNIAAWDGLVWHALGSGTDGPVHALATFDDEGGSVLVAAGSFATVGGMPANNIARWNGLTWAPLGAGIAGPAYGAAVSALVVYNSQLIAGGFSGAFKWTGSVWWPLGYPGWVRALTVHEGELIAGAGDPGGVYRWVESSWQLLGIEGELWGLVYALATYDGDLIAAGHLWPLCNWSGCTPTIAGHVARWDGSSWHSLGNGVAGPPECLECTSVYAIATYNGDLIAGGDFDLADGQPAKHLARWNGTAWAPLEAANQTPSPYETHALAVHGDRLIIGFGAGPAAWACVAAWDSSVWSFLGDGLNAAVFSTTAFGDDLIAGGWFTGAGGQSANAIARWNESSWQAMGSVGSVVIALTVFNNQLLASGSGVFLWNGGAWVPFGPNLSGGVQTFTTFNGELMAGGSFRLAANGPTHEIARWDGVSWSPFASGFFQPPDGINSAPAVVRALAVYNGDLIAGGRFTMAGEQTVNHIARWDGNTWQPLGSGLTPGTSWFFAVDSLTVYDGELVVAGNFTSAGGVAAHNVAAWNGTEWHSLGPGVGGIPCSWNSNVDCSRVYALIVRNGDLIAGGYFSSAGGTPCNNIARWDGTQWQAMGSGTDGPILTLALYGDQLAAGGSFWSAHGSVSAYLARWGRMCSTGDLNCDSIIDGRDVGPFIVALLDPMAYMSAYPDCSIDHADANSDTLINELDIDPFVACLMNGGCP